MKTILVGERERKVTYVITEKNKVVLVKEKNIEKKLSFNEITKFNILGSSNVKSLNYAMASVENISALPVIDKTFDGLIVKDKCFKQDVVSKPIINVNNKEFLTIIKLSSDMINSIMSTNTKPFVINIDNLKTPSELGGGVGNINQMTFTVQQQSFYELNIKFVSGKIIDVLNIPQGMIFENGRIKGAPIYAGKYIVKIILENQENFIVTINVSSIPRKL